ncbi:MAG: Ig-like domain-containing protein [Methylococcales bacterium]
MSVEVTNRNSVAYQATVSVEVTFADGYNIRGTGAIVGKNDMLTATHMIYDPEHGGLASSIDIFPGADYNDRLNSYQDTPFSFSFNSGAWKAVNWANQVFADDDDSTLIFSESQYDMALVGLNIPVGERIGGWFALDPGYNSAQYAYALGYPAGSTGMMKASTWISSELSRIPKYSVYSSYADNRGDLMGAGSSGGPLYVLENNVPTIIGVKSSGTTGVSNHWADIGLLYGQLTDIIAANDSLLEPVIITDDYTGTTDTTSVLTQAQASTGNIEIVGDTDWFQVKLSAGKTYQFDLTGSSAGGGTLVDPKLRLIDAAGKEVLVNDDIEFNINKDARLTFTPLNSEPYYLEAAGYESAIGTYTLAVKEVIDNSAPTIMFFSPDNGTTSAKIDADLVLTFNELIQRGSGTIVLQDASGRVVESFAVADSTNITVSGSTLTINPSASLANSQDYSVILAGGVVTDSAGNPYAETTDYQFATRAARIDGTDKADSFTGSTYADTYYAQAGNDRLVGGFGDDYLDGGKGKDTLIGGDGNDIYVVDNRGDKVVESGRNDFNDNVYSYISYTLGKNVESLDLEGKAKLNGNGNSLHNFLFGNESNNILSGKAGDDNLAGDLGNDKLTGGTGDDWFIFDTLLGKNNIDTITDFVRGSDQVILDSVLFAHFSGQANDFISVSKLSNAAQLFAGQHIIYDRTSHALYYDSDGAGVGNAPDMFVKLTGVSNLDVNDLLLL